MWKLLLILLMICSTAQATTIGKGTISGANIQRPGNNLSKNLFLAVPAWQALHPGAPFVLYVGDSIVEGYPLYQTSGSPNYIVDPSHNDERSNMLTVMSLGTDSILTGLNRSTSGAQVGFCATVASSFIASTHPKYVIFQAGINSLQAGDDWSTVGFNYDTVKTAAASAGATLIVSEVWPSPLTTSGNISAYNTSLNSWAVTNSIAIIASHDWMADPNDLTIMLAAYTTDGTHPSNAGVTRWQQLILNKLNSF